MFFGDYMDRKANPRLYDEIQDTEGLSSVRTSGKLEMCNKYVEIKAKLGKSNKLRSVSSISIELWSMMKNAI